MEYVASSLPGFPESIAKLSVIRSGTKLTLSIIAASASLVLTVGRSRFAAFWQRPRA